MEFVTYWATCGLIGFIIYLAMSWYMGEDITLKELLAGFAGFPIAGMLGLAALLVIIIGEAIEKVGDKTLIKGRKK